MDFIWPGGGDVDGHFFGESGNPWIQSINLQRDEFELELARLARRSALPTLGICRGCQVLNVAAGGSLVVDILNANPAALKHDPDPDHPLVSHPVELVKTSRLEKIYGTALLTVNSYHHQAVKNTGKGITISAYAPDHTVEGIEASDHPFYIGVQWHPERSKGNQPGIEVIFNALVESAQQFHRS
jgi:putative glutamine amidotransferase